MAHCIRGIGLSIFGLALLLTLPLYSHANDGAVAIAVPVEGGTVNGDAMPAPRGRTVVAGPGQRRLSRGRREPAGEGQRRGAWQTLGLTDGLPEGSVTSILQDRDGDLWFGTLDGLCRYDGEAFTTFATADGSWSNWIFSIGQDRQGDLWIGTSEGLRRFDGHAFTTYTSDDGLLDDGRIAHRVTSVLIDREEDVWFGTEVGVCRYDGESFTIFTREDGLVDDNVEAIAEDSQGNLWFGTPQGASRFNGEQFENFTSDDGLAVPVSSIIEGQKGEIWFGTWGAGVCRFDGEQFTVFTAKDGLAHDRVYAMGKTRQGDLWFGTRQGVSRYDGQSWETFTTEDGLAYEAVQSVLVDRSGDLWFGTGWEEGWKFTPGKGVSRFAGEEVVIYTMEDGLHTDAIHSMAEDRQGNIWFGGPDGVSWYDGREFHILEGLQVFVGAIVEDHQGNLWFGTSGEGVYRYDGDTLDQMTATDGLASDRVMSALVDGNGQLWFGCVGRAGASRYDGESFVTFDSTDGLSGVHVQGIAEDQSGDLWFGSWGGAFRFTGEEMVAYTMEDGLGSHRILSMGSDRQGNIWFGLDGSGVSRFDGETFVNFSTPDGLTGNYVKDFMEDRQGHLWIGTNNGITRFDGRVFQALHSSDGVPERAVESILQDRHGNIWVGTWGGGVVRFRPRTSPPPIRITNVVADRAHGPLAQISISATQDHLAFEFLGTSFKTRPDQMVYLYRLEGHDADWRQTRERRVAYEDLPVGEYVFQVQAVDRDLTYSEEPAEVQVVVHLPYGLVTLVVGLGLALIGLVVTSGYGLKRRRERDLARAESEKAREQIVREMEEELQTAHDMQMSLMPTESPQVAGIDVAGQCLPANHVGGDLFQYFSREGKFSISVADVTGHAMEAAIPVVMFSGILDTQMETAKPLEDLFSSLNRSLGRSLGKRTYVCFCMAEIDPEARTLRLASCGCPYPLHFRGGEVSELKVEGYPLGVRSDTTYAAIEVQLQQGDYLVFVSDGIPEAIDGAQEMFGDDRIQATIRQGCTEGLGAEALIERLLAEVRGFCGELAAQEDDMTCVVLRVTP